MEIKIQLPNPDDYQYANGVADWLSQMRISLKAAEKTYQEATKDLTAEAIKDSFYLGIEVPYATAEELTKLEDAGEVRGVINNNLYLRIWSV